MISIIVPVYNVDLYIDSCIESILEQTYKDIEVLLIDDGSTDHCGELCEKYAIIDKRVTVIHTENNGLSAARNIGLENAQGEYIGFVDADDWIEPDMYEVLLRTLEENDADISICGFWYDYSTSSKLFSPSDSLFNRTAALTALCTGNINNAVWNKLYKKTALTNILFPEGHNYEDISCMHSIIGKANLIATVAAPKYHYRQREKSIVKTYSASNLVDYANAFLSRYEYFKINGTGWALNEDELLRTAAEGISRLWRWWFRCGIEEKKEYWSETIRLRDFSRDKFSLFGYSTWPLSLQVSVFFMHSSNWFSFALLYLINQMYRMAHPKKLRVVCINIY